MWATHGDGQAKHTRHQLSSAFIMSRRENFCLHAALRPRGPSEAAGSPVEGAVSGLVSLPGRGTGRDLCERYPAVAQVGDEAPVTGHRVHRQSISITGADESGHAERAWSSCWRCSPQDRHSVRWRDYSAVEITPGDADLGARAE